MKRVLVVLCLASLVLTASAKIELATPFADGMVLQRGMKVPVWGKVVPEMNTMPPTVTVEFAGQEKSVTANPVTGAWKVELDPMEASKESRTLTVTEGRGWWIFGSTADTVEVKDVLVGEVWMCSGQSNADCPVWGGSPRYRDGWGAMTLTSVRKPFVRLVKTPLVGSVEPRYGYKAEWMKMTPEMYDAWKSGKRMPSAMGYYYALELANALDVPVGLVDSSWGGTNIDAWTPRSGYEGLTGLDAERDWKVVAQKDWKPEMDKGAINGWVQQPFVLWNGMVAAYAPMACRGLIWYQGCHNSGEPQRYANKMHALYNGWAKEFANPDLKLYFVQLAPWGSDNIAAIQMAQARFDAEEKNAGMAVINDVGNLTDIHPNDKRTVAKRLALHALKRDYGFDTIRDNSPTLKSWKIDGDRFVLSFDDVESWYIYNPKIADPTVGFEVAGADGVFRPARIVNLKTTPNWKTKKPEFKGLIDGRDLVVASDEVKEPVKLRYLHSRPWFGGLYSDMCLPLGAFAIGK